MTNVTNGLMPRPAPRRTHPRTSELPRPLKRESRFPYWFARISRALSQHLLLHVETTFGLNLAEYRTLNTVAVLKARSIRDIAADACLDKAQVSRALTALTKRGLVVQVVDGADRRLRVVKLTAAGEALIAQALPFVRERQKLLEAGLSDSERRILWKALTTISSTADRLLAEAQRNGGGQKLLPDRDAVADEFPPNNQTTQD